MENNISYADDWKNADNPIYCHPSEESGEVPESTVIKSKSSKPILTVIQISVCIIAVLAAYLLKTFGGEYYKEIRKSYYSMLNDEIILSEKFENFDLNKFFNDFKD